MTKAGWFLEVSGIRQEDLFSELEFQLSRVERQKKKKKLLTIGCITGEGRRWGVKRKKEQCECFCMDFEAIG